MWKVGWSHLYHPASKFELERGPTMKKVVHAHPDPDHPASKPAFERGPTTMEELAEVPKLVQTPAEEGLRRPTRRKTVAQKDRHPPEKVDERVRKFHPGDASNVRLCAVSCHPRVVPTIEEGGLPRENEYALH